MAGARHAERNLGWHRWQAGQARKGGGWINGQLPNRYFTNLLSQAMSLISKFFLAKAFESSISKPNTP